MTKGSVCVGVCVCVLVIDLEETEATMRDGERPGTI